MLMITTNRKKCNICFEKTGKEKPLSDFYNSNSILFSDGLVPICKKCLKENVDSNDIDSIKNMLQKIDKPFVAKVWKSAEKKGGDIFGNYLRMINSLPQYKSYTWSDSDFVGEESTDIYKKKFNNIDNIEELETEFGTIELNREVALKFGSGYTNIEYLQMEKFYREMDRTHNLDTPQLKKQVINLCKLQVKMDRALESDDANSYKKYADAYDAILKTSALTPKDKKSLSDSTGIRSFSAIFEEVEKHGYIEPKPISERKDLVDVAIIEHLNYVRILGGHGKLEKVPEDIKERLDEANGVLLGDDEYE